jgi:hypothetical protein
MKLFKYFLIISLVVFSNYSVSKEWMSDFFTDEAKARMFGSFLWLGSYKGDYNNKWIYTNSGLYSSNGEDLLSVVRGKLPFVMGDLSGFGLCSVSFVINKYPVCGKDADFKSNLINPTIIDFKSSPFSLWIPNVDLNGAGINGGILLSSGGAIPIDDFSDIALIYNDRNEYGLSGDSLSIFNSAHLIGMVVVLSDIVKNIKPYETCSLGYENYRCQKRSLGFYSLVGILLRDMASSCDGCSNNDKIALYYHASSYLLRVIGDKDVFLMGKKILDKYHGLFEKKGLDTDLLNKMYRQNILD